MPNLLSFTLQATFYVYGTFSLLLAFWCLIYSEIDNSIFFISTLICFIIGYFIKLLFNKKTTQLKNFLKVIFLSWLLLILVSSIPFYSLINVVDFNSIIFLSTSLSTTTGFNLNFFNYFQDFEPLLIWSSIAQLMGGFFSIISFILIFLVIFNNQNKYVLFNRILMIKFIVYYFLIFITFFLLIDYKINDFLNSIVIASAIISTGGTIGNEGNVLGYYFSNNSFLITYSVLIILTSVIVPFFLLVQNRSIFHRYYLKVLKRCFFLLIVSTILLFVTLNIHFLSFEESFFIFLSFVTTTGILPNKVSDFSILQKLYPFFFIFLLLIVIGGFSATSSGGLKIDRMSILIIKIKEELSRLTFRHKIYSADLIKKGSDQNELNSFYALLSFGICITTLSVLMLSILGYDLFEAFAISMAALTNTGEGFLYINNLKLNDTSFSLFILNFLMICGRFELIGYLLIFQKFIFKN